MGLEVNRSVLEEVAQDKEIGKLLDALDIDPQDQKKLGHIADSGHRGCVSISDLVNGLQRLRGIQRRSDTISVELEVQKVHAKIEEIHRLFLGSSKAADRAFVADSCFVHELTSSKWKGIDPSVA